MGSYQEYQISIPISFWFLQLKPKREWTVYCRSLESDDKLSNILERSRLSLAENNVLRVKELVCVALKHKRSIVDTVTLAIGKIYRARPSQEDKDLSFIVLELGGPTPGRL